MVELYGFLNLIFPGAALILSVYAINETRKLNQSREEFEENVRNAIVNYEYTLNHFPDLIEDFKNEIEKFNRIKGTNINESFDFLQLRTRYRRGLLNPIKQINPDLYRQLKYIHNNLIIDFSHYIDIQRQAAQVTLDRWIEHLKSHDHGGFPENVLAERILWNALPSILDGNNEAIERNFYSELEVTLGSNMTFQNNYTEDTPGRLIEIADQQLAVVKKQIEKIEQHIHVIKKEAIDKMEEKLGTSPMEL